jgi:hypothetical protein
MLENVESTQARHPVPFYGSYAAFLRAMKVLKENGIPRRLNPRTLSPLLGDEGPRVATHFISMEWVDDVGAPTEHLRALVASFGEPNWKRTLLEEIERFYSFVPGPWEDLTEEKLHDAFLSHTGREAKVLKSAETFFLSVALECEIGLPDRLYLRANRAHSEAKRPKEGQDEDHLSESKEAEIDIKLEPSKPAPKQKPPPDGWIDQIVKLSTLLNDSDLSEPEQKAVKLTISVLAKKMNAA